jgi:indolepyruvate ferredoxin oxidoreductase
MVPVSPAPQLPALDRPWAILIAGIGGTGVITIGHILGMAAHVEGKGAALVDMTGLSQKNGAVVTHLKIAASHDAIAAVRIAAGGADLVLGCDLVTAASAHVLLTCSRERSQAVINIHPVMPAQFTRDADFQLPAEEMWQRIRSKTRADKAHDIDATGIATALLGDGMAANMFTLGCAYQRGLLPLEAVAIERAIELNGVAVRMNIDAFRWGRHAAFDRAAVEAIADRPVATRAKSVDELIDHRARFLAAYQDEAYAKRYRRFLGRVRAQESTLEETAMELSQAVARYLFKLMAYKDEYEVARLYTDGEFERALAARFRGGRLTFHLAPPLLARRDPVTGQRRKRTLGPWVLPAFRILARLRFLRGTRLDVFGYSRERRRERALIEEYCARIDALLPSLSERNIKLAVEIASLPEQIRGFGHVKDRHLAAVETKTCELLAAYHGTKLASQAIAA